MAEQDTTSALAPRLAEEIRDKLIAGELKPGQRLSEAALSDGLDVSGYSDRRRRAASQFTYDVSNL